MTAIPLLPSYSNFKQPHLRHPARDCAGFCFWSSPSNHEGRRSAGWRTLNLCFRSVPPKRRRAEAAATPSGAPHRRAVRSARKPAAISRRLWARGSCFRAKARANYRSPSRGFRRVRLCLVQPACGRASFALYSSDVSAGSSYLYALFHAQGWGQRK